MRVVRQEPTVLYGRVVFIGIGTVVITSLVDALILGSLHRGGFNFVAVPYALTLGGMVCLVGLVPMLLLWTLCFGALQSNGKGVRANAMTTAGLLAAAGALAVGLVVYGIVGEARAVAITTTCGVLPVCVAVTLAGIAFAEPKGLGAE